MKNASLFLFVFLTTSCLNQDNLTPFMSHPVGGRPGIGVSAPQDDDRPQKESLWLSALEYDSSYNWQQDSLCGNAPCKAVLFKDMKRIVSFDAGAGTVSDAMMISGGHLYTYWSDRQSTSILCDGELLFSYPQKETLSSILVCAEDVFTLGCSGSGFCFRRNGQIVKAYSSGRPGSLYEDEGVVCYCRYESGSSEPIHCENGEDAPLDVWDGCVDLRVVGGEVWELVIDDGLVEIRQEGCLVDEFSYDSGLSAVTGRLFPYGEGCAAQISAVLGQKSDSYFFVPGSELLRSQAATVFFPLREDGEAAMVECSSGTVKVSFGGEYGVVGGKWRMMGENCAAFAGREPVLALSSHTGRGVAIWRPGGSPLQSIDINGCLTGVKYE